MKAPKNKAQVTPAPRRRMSPEVRRALILRESIGYFATHGFSIDTRSLAQHLQITQALLYKYFPSKQSLVEAVFETVFEKQSPARWSALLRDRETNIKTRLRNFFVGYADSTYDYDWIRVYTQAAFAGGNLNQKYINQVTRPLLHLIAEETRLAAGLSATAAAQVSELEIELLWQFHFGLYYHPYRRHVYGAPSPVPLEAVVDASLDGLLGNLAQVVSKLHPGEVRLAGYPVTST